MEQRLGGDAAAVEARTAEPVALDDGDTHAQIGGTQGRRVAAGPAAQDHDVEAVAAALRLCHLVPPWSIAARAPATTSSVVGWSPACRLRYDQPTRSPGSMT